MSSRRPSDPGSLRAAGRAPVRVCTPPGPVPYRTARDWQRRLAGRRAAGRIGDVLLLLEHLPVYTAGRRAEDSHLLWDERERSRRGLEVIEVDRGGQVTYHGPGQLVGYPVVRLADRRVADWVRALEEVNLRLAATHGVEARRVGGRPGVWVGGDKLTAVGARVLASRVTQHGWATNVTTDLEAFGGIVACGHRDAGVCSLRSLGAEVDLAAARRHSATLFGEVLRCSLEAADLEDLGLSGERRGARAPTGRTPRIGPGDPGPTPTEPGPHPTAAGADRR